MPCSFLAVFAEFEPEICGSVSVPAHARQPALARPRSPPVSPNPGSKAVKKPMKDPIREDRIHNQVTVCLPRCPICLRKLRRSINAYSANTQPIRSKYSDITHRIHSDVQSATASNYLRPRGAS